MNSLRALIGAGCAALGLDLGDGPPVLDLIDQQDLAAAEGFLLDGQADQATRAQAMPRQWNVLVVEEQGVG